MIEEKQNMLLEIILLMFIISISVFAHSGDIIPSPGIPAGTIDVTNTSNTAEWTGAYPFMIDNGHPHTADVLVLHKADGIYLRLEITDATPNNSDALKIFFDLAHDAGSVRDEDDWGIEVTRDGVTKKWGAGNMPSTLWSNIPSTNMVGVSALGTNPWIVELRIPSGIIPPQNTHTLDFATDGGKIGIYIQLFSVFEEVPDPSAIYNQWPDPTSDPNDPIPSQWGNYVFDDLTTFPDLSLTGVRRGDAGAENYYKISHTATNLFEVKVENPGGTVIADADNVRINLYLSARGLGEPFKRLDQESVINGDCGNSNWLSYIMPNKNDFCSGTTSLDDISTQNINDIVNNTAQYTIKDGMPMTRLDGESITIPAGTNDWKNILDWNTTSSQDSRFTEVIVNGTTYRRQHLCMKAEVVYKNDPNTTNNTRQVNMDFVCVPGGTFSWFLFSAGWAGFSDYNPRNGKDMYMQVELQNMDPQFGWRFNLEGAETLGRNTFKARLKGTQSLGLQLGIQAPAAKTFGRTLKENLIIPPKSGGRHANARKNSGKPPVYVKVKAGKTLWITNYDFNENDEQFVDVDGRGKRFRHSGPAGLPDIADDLMASNAPVSSLIGSFDNFKNSFLIGAGVQVKVPAGATYLALGINDEIGKYDDNVGTGFRIKVLERTSVANDWGILDDFFGMFASTAIAQQKDTLQIVPIDEVMPILCINGYEATGQFRNIGGQKHQLYRYIGNVCWGVLNVFPVDRSKEPDRGDPFKPEPEDGNCSSKAPMGMLISSLMLAFGLTFTGLYVRKKKNNNGLNRS